MKPVEFPEMNTKFVAPGCGDLPVHMDGKNIVSCWELTDEERQKIADGGNLWLMIVGMPAAGPHHDRFSDRRQDRMAGGARG
jgi:hypothetical protein